MNESPSVGVHYLPFVEEYVSFCPVGLKGDLSLLDVFIFPRGLEHTEAIFPVLVGLTHH